MDIWKVGLVRRRMKDIILARDFEGASIHWLEEDRSFSFLADPFGLWRDGRLTVFVEAYNYRSRLGHIEALVFSDDLRLLDRRPCLREPWHLSYPFVFQDGGETWMLPEAHRSGAITLYRNLEFPYRWRAECVLDLPELAVDATPMFHDGLWWLFYSPIDRSAAPRLHAAYATSLQGRWKPHPLNPLLTGSAASRPGGTPILADGRIVLPVQDSSAGYGSCIRLLTLSTLTPQRAEVEIGASFCPPSSAAPFNDGFHTLSAAGDITLIDVKRLERSLCRLPIDALGRCRRAARGWFPRPL
jgi:hypothetical protein